MELPFFELELKFCQVGFWYRSQNWNGIAFVGIGIELPNRVSVTQSESEWNCLYRNNWNWNRIAKMDLNAALCCVSVCVSLRLSASLCASLCVIVAVVVVVAVAVGALPRRWRSSSAAGAPRARCAWRARRRSPRRSRRLPPSRLPPSRPPSSDSGHVRHATVTATPGTRGERDVNVTRPRCNHDATTT